MHIKKISLFLIAQMSYGVHATDLPSFFSVKFDQSPSLIHSHPSYYDTFKQSFYRISSALPEPKIPKIIHQVWIGDKPLPKKFQRLMQKWQEMHPDWIYMLWHNINAEWLNLENKRAYDAAKNFGMKADIIRYEVLYRFGGVYIDVDFEAVQNLDELHKYLDFYAGIVPDCDIVNNAFIACTKNHPVMRECIDRIKKCPDIQAVVEAVSAGDYTKVHETTGPYMFTDVLYNYLVNTPESKTAHSAVLPISFLHSFPPERRFEFAKKDYNLKYIKEHIHPETFAVHYWATSWQD